MLGRRAEVTRMIEFRPKSTPMPMFKAGDHVKVEFKDDRTGESEWMG